MTEQKFNENLASLEYPIQKSIYKYLYSQKEQGAQISSIQEGLPPEYNLVEIESAVKHLRSKELVFVKNERIVASLFDPHIQNLDPWYRSINEIDLNFLDRLRRAALEIIRSRRSPNIQLISSTLRSLPAFQHDLSEKQIERVVSSLVYDQLAYKIGEIYYYCGKCRIGESLNCTPCGQCLYLQICDMRGLGSNCKYIAEWLSM